MNESKTNVLIDSQKVSILRFFMHMPTHGSDGGGASVHKPKHSHIPIHLIEQDVYIGIDNCEEVFVMMMMIGMVLKT